MEIKKRIHASECDFELKTSLFALVNMIQNMATETLGEIKLDNVTLREKYNAMWVFTKNQFKCMRRPIWNEEVTLRSRRLKSNRLIYYMLIEMIDSHQEIILSDVLELCVLDRNTFRFKRLSEVGLDTVDCDIDIDYTIPSLTYEPKCSVEVTPTMIDYSMHLNNAQSILIFLNHLTLEETTEMGKCPFKFTIHYRSQARLNEKMTLNLAKENGTYGYRLDKEDGTNVVCATVEHHS